MKWVTNVASYVLEVTFPLVVCLPQQLWIWIQVGRRVDLNQQNEVWDESFYLDSGLRLYEYGRFFCPVLWFGDPCFPENYKVRDLVSFEQKTLENVFCHIIMVVNHQVVSGDSLALQLIYRWDHLEKWLLWKVDSSALYPFEIPHLPKSCSPQAFLPKSPCISQAQNCQSCMPFRSIYWYVPSDREKLSSRKDKAMH